MGELKFAHCIGYAAGNMLRTLGMRGGQQGQKAVVAPQKNAVAPADAEDPHRARDGMHAGAHSGVIRLRCQCAEPVHADGEDGEGDCFGPAPSPLALQRVAEKFLLRCA